MEKTPCIRKNIYSNCPYVEINRYPHSLLLYCKTNPCPHATELLLRELIETVKDLKTTQISVL